VVKIFGLEQYQNIFDGSSLRLILHMIKSLLNEAVSEKECAEKTSYLHLI